MEEVRVAAGQPAEAAVPSEGPDFALAEAIAGFKDEWAQAGISNVFLFGKIMTANPDLLLELLQYTLPEMRIQSIRDVGREIDIKFSFDAHGVDACAITPGPSTRRSSKRGLITMAW